MKKKLTREIVSIYLPDDLLSELESHAKANGRSRSADVVFLLQSVLRPSTARDMVCGVKARRSA
jgi:metal-responsive CopG/Arc/MetJ family transcriptional regulator